MLSWFLVAALDAPVPWKTDIPSSPIVNGERSVAGAWPSVVAVVIGTDGWCTGILIDDRTVLTAAHCVAGQPPRRVYFGDGVHSGTGTFRWISRWNVHPEYGGEEKTRVEMFDFAYVELAESTDVEPAPLILTQELWDEVMFEGSAVTLVGYGTAHPDSEGGDGWKREVVTSMGAFSERALEFRAGGGGLDSCKGDSGGPAFVHTPHGPMVAGVLSRGSEICGDGGWYGVPLGTVAWLVEEGVYTPEAACIDIECIDRSSAHQAAGGCACSAQTPRSQDLTGVLCAVGGWPSHAGAVEGTARTSPRRRSGVVPRRRPRRVDETFATVERGDRPHFLGRQHEVEDGEVLLAMRGTESFGDRHQAKLKEPSQRDLSRRLPVALPDRGELR